MTAIPLAYVAPHLHATLAPRYRRVPVERIETYLEQVLGGASIEDVEDFLGTLAGVAQAVLPVLLPAVGTVIGGPIGTAVGAAAGTAASAGIKAATAGRSGRPPRAQPPKAPPSVPPPPATTARSPSAPATARAKRPAAPSPQSVAAAQLLALLFSHELLQTLGRMLVGPAAGGPVQVGGERVTAPAMLNLLAELADRAAAEAANGAERESVVAGDYDATSAEERAGALWDVLRGAWTEDDETREEDFGYRSWPGGM